MVFEQCGNGEKVLRENCPEGGEEVVGIAFVIRSRTCVTVTNAICYSAEASQCTAKQLTQLAEILPEGAQVDMVLATDLTLAALGTCADILAQGLDIDHYCQDPDWKNVIEIWKNNLIHREACLFSNTSNESQPEASMFSNTSPCSSFGCSGSKSHVQQVVQSLHLCRIEIDELSP
jgi:hypothetical protein